MFQLFEGIVLLLAVLIAFNAAGISVEGRRRELATMFAFGVPRWKAVRPGPHVVVPVQARSAIDA